MKLDLQLHVFFQLKLQLHNKNSKIIIVLPQYIIIRLNFRLFNKCICHLIVTTIRKNTCPSLVIRDIPKTFGVKI